LLVAAQYGRAECIQLLLNAGADKEATQIKRATVLLMAAQNGHIKCVELLLNAGADKTATIYDRSTALMAAASNGHLQCTELLLKAGCDVNALNNNGCSALFLAVLNNHVNCVRALVQAGADITIQPDGISLDKIIIKKNYSDEIRAALLVPAQKRRRCEQCGTTTTGQKMKKCGACKTVYYCNRDCQTANWPLHKQVCSAADE
jgi:ankyrin repeat protein